MEIKVLSLIEPWGTLIKDKKKFIETRSWKTDYRGDLFIHTSKRKINMFDDSIIRVSHLFKKEDLQYGKILCKCSLVDCVFMDNGFIEKILENEQEYLCGFYEYGRYAWIIENIEQIKPIETNGQLRLWNYEADNIIFEKDRVKPCMK